MAAPGVTYHSQRFHGLAGRSQEGLRAAEREIAHAIEHNEMRLKSIAERDRPKFDGEHEYGVIVDTKLMLSNLELTSLPEEELSQCTALEFIDCSTNHLERLPGTMIVPKLKTLWCHSNPLRELPEEIGRCESLKEVFYGECPDMVYPPPTFSEGGSHPTAEAATKSLCKWIRENPRCAKVKAARG